MSRPTVGVVVATYKQRDSLSACLSAILAQQPDEVVLVIDGPSTSARQLAADIDDPRLVVVELAQNLGRSNARRCGLEKLTTEIVLLVDDDVVVHTDAIEAHRIHHQHHAQLVVVGYMDTVVPSSPSSQDFATVLYRREYESAVREWDAKPQNILPRLWGGHVSLPTAVARQVMTNELNQVHYHEDTIVGIKCARLGMSGVFDRSITSSHLHQRDMSGFLIDAIAMGHARRYLNDNYAEAAEMDPGLALANQSFASRLLTVTLARVPRAVMMIAPTVCRRLSLAANIRLAKALRRAMVFSGAKRPRRGPKAAS